MQRACNTSELKMPSLPAVTTRDRLVRRIRACRSNGLIWIIGQAAQGKTTLAADFLRQSALPTAWLSLNTRDDTDAARFFSRLVEALAPTIPSIDLRALFSPVLKSQSPPVQDIAGHLADRLQELGTHVPEQIQIVLDGLDRLPDQGPTIDFIRRLCGTMVRSGRLWILSRRIPPFEYQQAIVNRQMLVLNNDDLAFTQREIQIYFEAVHQLNLPPECIDLMHQVTEGWPGGLVLLAQALERMPASQWIEYLSRGLPSRLQDETQNYFREEVFSDLPGSTRALLLHAAVFENIDPVMLEDVLGVPDGREQLERLVLNNAFIRILHDNRGVRRFYRLNPLFRQFLRAAFEKKYSPAEQKSYFARIAAFYDSHGETAAAIKWHFLADDYERAGAGLKRIGTDLVIRGRYAELAEQIHPFPEDQCQSDPWLFFLRALTGRIHAGRKCLDDFESALARFSSHGDVRGQMLALSHLIEAGILLGETPAVYLRWVAKAEAWLAQQRTTHYYAWAKTLLWLYIGYGYIVSGLDITKGLSAAHNALVLARKIENPVLSARAAIISALGLATAGEYAKADEMLSKIGPEPTVAMDEYHLLLAMTRVELSLRRGNLAAARQLIQSVGRDIEAYGLLFLFPAYLDACGFLQIYEARYTEARATSRYLLDVALLTGNPIYKGLSHRLSSLIHYYQGNDVRADAEARLALAEMGSGGPDTLHVMRTKQLLAAVSLHLEEYDAAGGLLNETAAFFEQTANPLSLAETFLLLGLWAHATGRPDLSERSLNDGFRIINAHRFDRLVLIDSGDLRSIVRIASRYEIQLPERWGDRPDAGRQSPQSASVSDSTPPGHVSGSRVPPLMIKTFGGFSVLRGGVTPIGEDEWGGQRPKLLFKAILVRGLREIPKDLLMDDLWPESSPETALQNFKVTLHRLRRILEPGLQKGKGSAYVHLKGNLVSLDRENCSVDLEQFLDACKQIKRQVHNGDADRIGVLGRTLNALYQGDFLPEEPYAPWVEMKRWALKDEYIEVLLKMAGLHQLQKQPEAAAEFCRTILRIDSCNEAAAQTLIRLYAAQGRFNEAWQVYEHLDHVLRTELGVSPEPATTALMKMIETDDA